MDQRLKDITWERVMREESGGNETKAKENYFFLIRDIEKEARELYDGGGPVDGMPPLEFRLMMIKDGCFFLQWVLYVLDPQLTYSSNDGFIFGKKNNDKDLKKWIESVYFVGNQIPLVLLSHLIKGSFFEKIILKGNWEPPLNFSKRVLYEFLLLPALTSCRLKSKVTLSTFFARLKKKLGLAKKQDNVQKQQASDLLHALHLLVLGPECESVNEEGEEGEVEDDGEDLGDASQGLRSATELRQAGIHFKIDSRIGCRGICFRSNPFNGVLTLPILMVDDETELLFNSLMIYEKTHEMGKNRSEVSSYIQFMSELVQTLHDVRLLASTGVIQGDLKQRGKLPKMLNRLAKETSQRESCQNLRFVRLQINDFSRPPWEKFKQFLSIVVVLTLVQTIFSVLQYFKGGH